VMRFGYRRKHDRRGPGGWPRRPVLFVRPEARPEKYDALVLQATQSLDPPLRPGGELLHAYVAHDDGCPKLRGDHCTCSPTVRIIRDGEEIPR